MSENLRRLALVNTYMSAQLNHKAIKQSAALTISRGTKFMQKVMENGRSKRQHDMHSIHAAALWLLRDGCLCRYHQIFYVV